MCYKSLFFLVVTAFTLTFSGCGGSSNSSGNNIGTNQPLSGNVISGVASKGIIASGKIKIFSLKSDGSKGDLLAATSTDSNGEFTATVGFYTGPILVEASGDYQDEATGQQMTIAESSPMRAAHNNVTGNATVSVTPFSEMAVQIAASLTPTNILNANNLIATLFPFHPISTKPVAVIPETLATASKAQRDYTISLAALSKMAQGSSINTIISTLSAEIKQNKNLTSSAGAFITALHSYLDTNPQVKAVVQDSELVLLGFNSENLSVNSIAIGPNGTLYAGINAFAGYSSPKINTFKSYSSVSIYQLDKDSIGNRWQLFSKITNAWNSSWSKLVINQSIIYASFDTTLFKYNPSDSSWLNLGAIGLIEDIDIDSSSIVYLATLSSMYKSNNASGWDKINNGLPGATIYSIAIDSSSPNILYAGGQGIGIYKSTNAGLSWSPVNTGLSITENDQSFLVEISSIVIAPSNTSIIYAASYNPNGNVFKSSDGGSSWSAVINGDSTNNIMDRFFRVAVDPTDAFRVYAIGLNGLYFSSNGGKTWSTTLTTAGLTRNIWDIVIDPTNTNIMYVSYTGGVLRGIFNADSILWTNITQ